MGSCRRGELTPQTSWRRQDIIRLIAVLMLSICSTAQAITFLTEEKPPSSYSEDGGRTLTGASVELLREVLRRSAIPGTMAIYPWPRAYATVQSDEDTCIFLATLTPERKDLFKWVGPVAPSQWTLYALADSSITGTSVEDFRPYSIGVVHKDVKADYFNAKGFRASESGSDVQNLKKLAAGRIDLWASTDVTGKLLAKEHDIPVKAVYAFQELAGYIACNLAVPDVDISKMNAALKSIKTDGTYAKIRKKFLGAGNP